MEDEEWLTFVERALKKGDSVARSDYSILSVSVITLGLILMIEFARHKMDHFVKHREFARAVLDQVYEERKSE